MPSTFNHQISRRRSTSGRTPGRVITKLFILMAEILSTWAIRDDILQGFLSVQHSTAVKGP
eukprot:3160131-Ditylum_brightwellii.AAC.1